MLMTGLANRYAHQLIQAREAAEFIPSLSSRYPLTIGDAYEIAARVAEIRIAEGENIVGRKLDYFLETSSDRIGKKNRLPFWSWLFDSGVRFMENSEGDFSLRHTSAPFVETEIIFRLGRLPPEGATIGQLAACIEWMAHGLEITEYPFRAATRSLVDTIAGFGQHHALLVGEPKIVSEGSRKSLYAVMEGAGLSLACNNVIRTAGFGSSPCNNPLQGLLILYQMLANMPEFSPLQVGDIIATGTWTKPLPIQPGEVWQTAVSGLPLSGLPVAFTA